MCQPTHAIKKQHTFEEKTKKQFNFMFQFHHSQRFKLLPSHPFIHCTNLPWTHLFKKPLPLESSPVTLHNSHTLHRLLFLFMGLRRERLRKITPVNRVEDQRNSSNKIKTGHYLLPPPRHECQYRTEGNQEVHSLSLVCDKSVQHCVTSAPCHGRKWTLGN